MLYLACYHVCCWKCSCLRVHFFSNTSHCHLVYLPFHHFYHLPHHFPELFHPGLHLHLHLPPVPSTISPSFFFLGDGTTRTVDSVWRHFSRRHIPPQVRTHTHSMYTVQHVHVQYINRTACTRTAYTSYGIYTYCCTYPSSTQFSIYTVHFTAHALYSA